jgi:hypothetical protein
LLEDYENWLAKYKAWKAKPMKVGDKVTKKGSPVSACDWGDAEVIKIIDNGTIKIRCFEGTEHIHPTCYYEKVFKEEFLG